MITMAQRVIIPCIYAYLALAISESLFGNSILQMLMNLTKWGITSMLTILTLGFGAYLSLTGLISGSADALAVKSARTVIARSLPIVGGILSDSASVFLSAAAIIRNSAGVFSLIAVCALCVWLCALTPSHGLAALVLHGLIAVALSNAALFLCYRRSGYFAQSLQLVKRLLKR